MANELPSAGSATGSASFPPGSSLVMFGRMQQEAAVPSASHPLYDPPSQWRNLTSTNDSPPLADSSVLSLSGSNETESEEDDCDDYIAGLAEQIAHSMLDDDETSEESMSTFAWTGQLHPSWSVQATLPASPQSTLAGIGCCGWNRSNSNSLASSKGSSQVSSRVSSPPSTPLEVEDDSWDLLYAAAGEVVRLKISNERRALLPPRDAVAVPSRASSRRQQLSSSTRQTAAPLLNLPYTESLARDLPIKSGSFSTSNPPSYSRDKASPAVLSNLQRSGSGKAWDEERSIGGQFRAPKQGSPSWGNRGGSRPLLHHQGSAVGGKQRGAGCSHRSPWGIADCSSSPHFRATSQQQQQQAFMGGNNGSGMRAVFLGATGSRESGGTGVFLPRRIGSGPETRKKPACSTVLLPSRIVQALNLNVEDIVSVPASSSSSAAVPATPRRDVSSSASSLLRSNSSAAGGALNGSSFAGKGDWAENQWPSVYHPFCSALQEVAPEISLPTEWTY